MSTTTAPTFTAAEKALSDAWDEHLRTEFAAHSADEAIATMTDDPHVNQVPVMTGGNGKAQLHEFYAKHFLPQIPPDLEMTPISRTVGQGRVVDELFARFTHTITMDWMLPGIPPTGKRVELAFVVVVQFDGGKVAHEHLYWDQASVLVQLGLLDPKGLPVVGGEAARSVVDRSVPLNGLIDRARAAR
ncbi:MAG: nuclear transport factor 2 family protein [Minicystis sp.]